MQEKTTIEGYVEHIIFRNDDNGYTVLNLAADGEEVTCVGSLPFISEGEYIKAEGIYTAHVSYGEQFKIEHCEATVPRNELAVERYLGSGAIKGVGAALASRIVRRFKKETMHIIEHEPERLAEIKGISERKAREIARQVAEKKDMQDAMLFLAQYGISTALAVRIYNRYGTQIYHIIRENPYQMADDIPGVGFKTADDIAQRAGILADSDFRVRSGLLYVLSQAQGEGHIYLPWELLAQRTAQLLEVPGETPVTGEAMEKQLSDLVIERRAVVKTIGEEKCVYAAPMYYMELNTARMLKDLNITCGIDESLVQRRIEGIEKREGIELDPQQKKAILEAARCGLVVITGGPGTGKTTTINTMITYFEQEGLEIELAAPTGRAAKRMTEATGREARTIHRLLEVSGGPEGDGASFGRNASNPLETDVVIIDEMSMVDCYLMYALLSALTPGTRLVMVGDVNQLPSVGPGSILRDIISAQCCSVVRLERIFRQAEESDIVMNAHRINTGKQPVLDNKSRDFFFLSREDANVIISIVIQLVRDKLPGYVHASASDIQVLTPTRKGLIGVERLNRILQEYLNPPAGDKRELHRGEIIFREGDKVMQIKNNYQAVWEVRGRYGYAGDSGSGIFNGDTGIIRRIDEHQQILTVEFDEHRFVEYPFASLEELEHAYAVTIHKSQGSEYPAVVIPIMNGPRMLMNRNLIYTAITRAKSCVAIVGDPQTLTHMVENDHEQKRYTSLSMRIEELTDGAGDRMP